jgi:precorrin-2 dehydrogenase/sirohydrochlorin ferrochelatase
MKLVREKRIEYIGDSYKDGYLKGAFLVIGATDRPEVNRRIFEDARKEGILVNIVDEPSRCDFIVPSIVERGDLTIAVSTGGKSPALSRRVREDLENRYGPEYGVLLRIMGKVREKVLERGEVSEANRRIFEGLLESPLLACIREKRWADVQGLIREYVGEDIPLD